MYTITVTSDGSTDQAVLPTRLAQRQVSYPTVNLGPMTSPFNPPAGCESLTNSYSDGTLAIFDYGRTCEGTLARQLKTSCYPSRYAAAWNAKLYPVFSPGSICPVGYVSACGFTGATSTPSVAEDDQYDFNVVMTQILASTEKAIACCPSGFVCWQSPAYHCLRPVPTTSQVTINPNTGCTSRSVELETVKGDAMPSMFVQAPCVMLVDKLPRKNTDTITSTNTFASSAPSRTFSASDGGSNSVNGTSNNSGNNNNSVGSGLSTGAKAAIGASIPLAAIFAGLAVFAFMRRRSRRTAAGYKSAATGSTSKGFSTSDGVEMNSSKHGQAAMTGVPLHPDHSATFGQGVSEAGATELYGSTVSPCLHENVMELPARFNAHGAARPRA